MAFCKVFNMKCILALIVTLSFCCDKEFYVKAKEFEAVVPAGRVTNKIASTGANLVRSDQNLRSYSTARKLQEADDSSSFTFAQFLGIVLNGSTTVLGSVGIVLDNIVQMTNDIVELIADDGFSVASIVNVIGESVVEIVVEISASVVSFLVEDFSFLLQNNIEETLKEYDPLDLFQMSPASINATSFDIASNGNCTISFNLTGMIIQGLSNVNFDTFEIDEFSYSNKNIAFTWDLKVAVPKFDIDFKGFIKSTDMCAGGEVEYLAENSFGEVALVLGVRVIGTVSGDGSELEVTSADFSKIGLEGLETSDTTLSSIAPYDDKLRSELLAVFDQLVDRLFGDLSSVIPDPENVLNDVGVELPLTVPLPIPIPF